MAITAAQVKELRQTTGAGMMECKKALGETEGDMKKAVIWLRERGISRAAKKEGRTAAEGVVQYAISPDKTRGVLIELNCETDFAGQNPDFQALSHKIASVALEKQINDIEELRKTEIDGTAISAKITELVASIGENITLRRVETIAAKSGLVEGYNHMNGKIGALVALENCESDNSLALCRDLAMHVAATAPKYFDRSEVSQSVLDEEKEISRKRLLDQGKSPDIIEKILIGQMNKFYSEVCFVDQPFVKEPKLTVTKHIKATDSKAKATGFIRFQLGEGIQVEEKDFAKEVADQLK